YGSAVMKQVYIYGGLDTGPTILKRGFGFRWNVGGWLLFHFLGRTDPTIVQKMHERVAAEMTTTFASHFTDSISLAEALDPDIALAYQKKVTGQKYLIAPAE
ncbi:NADH oxidase, partial [Paracoccus sp. Z118]|nr:NADH oxidase [Paracoccus sp. Z118]